MSREAMRSQPLRLLTIGAGFFSRFHHGAWARLADEGRVERIGVCDRDVEKARAFAGEFGFDTTFDDAATAITEAKPDLIDIIAPPAAHRDLVLLARGAGAAVICQKPFTPNLEQAEALVAELGVGAEQVFIHENFRFQPWFQEAKRLIDTGRLGQVYQATFRLRPGDGQGAEAYLERQPYFRTMERFLVHETAIHLIDTFRYLLGEATAVYADLRRLNPAIRGEDAGHILLDFGPQCRALFDGNRLVDHAADNHRLTLGELLIEGSEAVLQLDGRGRLWLRAKGEGEPSQHAYPWQDIDYAGDCVYRTNRAILDGLSGGPAFENTASAYLTNLRIEAAAYCSAEEGRRLDL